MSDGQAGSKFAAYNKVAKVFIHQLGHSFLSFQDSNGYIEDTELMAFLRDLLEKKDMVMIPYCRVICSSNSSR